MVTRKQKEHLKKVLGMPKSSAERRLRKLLIFRQAQRLFEDHCSVCGSKIQKPEDFAVVHRDDWETATQYFDLNNITFCHVTCKRDEGMRFKETMANVISVSIVDEFGNSLQSGHHQNQFYVGGVKNTRYRIRVQNLTGGRILVVTTVDGRNILDGKPGDLNGGGYVLSPFDTEMFDGWRTSDSSVAAFRLSSAGDSYSSQMGSPQNVGVIGVAAFEEKTIPPKKVSSILRTQGFTYSSSCSYGGETKGLIDCDDGITTQTLGTGFGEDLSSHVTTTTFQRRTSTPAQTILIRYDDLESLRAKGILSTQQSPSAFPVNSGYCPTPPRRS